MPWPTREELDDLVTRFRARTLPKDEWTHFAHLAVGTWHVHQHGPEHALELIRTGITRLNEVHGTVNDDAGGEDGPLQLLLPGEAPVGLSAKGLGRAGHRAAAAGISLWSL